MKAEQLYKVTTSVRNRREAAAPAIPGAAATDSVDFGRSLDTDLLRPDHDRSSDLEWVGQEDLDRELERANVLAERLPERPMSFELEYDGDQPVVVILARDTQEVLRQMSPTDFLNFMSAVHQTVGLFFDRLA